MRTKFLFASLLMLISLGVYAQEETPVKKYGFKSAIVKLSTDMMGQTVQSTAYVDDYGAKESQKIKMSVPGMGEMESGSIIKDGKAWSVNYTMKQVQEVDLGEIKQPNFLDLSEDMMKEFNIQEVGTGKVLDKDCVIYTMETETQGMTAKLKVWCYKGFTLKSVTDISGMTITATATDFQEDVMVLPQVFDVPKY
ncbi:MAG: hypothetical protein IJ840_05270 [Bacteroidales bacterium]|nr:hypothetical protein [Bacteroidales bacterium]